MTELTDAQASYLNQTIKPYVESVYAMLEAELDYYNSDEVQELRLRPRRYESVGEMLRLKKVAIIGTFEIILPNAVIIELSLKLEVSSIDSDMYIDAVKEVFTTHTNVDGLEFTFLPNVGVLVRKA